MSLAEKKSKEKLSDNELIKLIINGEVNLYRIIMRRYNQRLYRTAVSFGINDFDCDDILQQTYLHAFEKLEQFRGDAKFSTWLTRILVNECLMHKRKQKLENQKFPDFENSVTNYSLKHQTPEREILNKEMKNILEQTIINLPEKYKTVYILREIEGTSVKECSDILGISEVNVKVRLLRAKNLLKDKLLETFDKNEILTFGNERCDAVADNVMMEIENKKQNI